VNIVDSSGWLEFFINGPNAEVFSEPLSDPAKLIVPTISLYEVFKVTLHRRGEDAALQAAAIMYQATMAELTAELALSAARVSIEHKLPMADSIMLATARAYEALFWTQDRDFEEIPEVRFVPPYRD